LIVTVTLNAAIDRTLTVPNFQPGHRHRASASLTSAGGKGINVARALKRLDAPVIATGLAGGRTGDRIVEGLAGEALLNDFVRIDDESRTSTAVVDPTAGTLTEIYEWGPAVQPEELETLRDKLRYLARVATYVVLSGSLPRDVEDDVYAEIVRDLNRRGVKCVVDTEGEPLRHGVDAEPFLVSPNQREAESLVGQEFQDDEDFRMALDAIAELGARNVIISYESGCFALFREERTLTRYHASVGRIDPVAAVGAGDVLLAGFLAARFNGRTVEDALCLGVGCAAASVLELGPGRFDPREASRLASAVELEELQPLPPRRPRGSATRAGGSPPTRFGCPPRRARPASRPPSRAGARDACARRPRGSSGRPGRRSGGRSR
jgi:1-phosphofructokinase family hexose kinase